MGVIGPHEMHRQRHVPRARSYLNKHLFNNKIGGGNIYKSKLDSAEIAHETRCTIYIARWFNEEASNATKIQIRWEKKRKVVIPVENRYLLRQRAALSIFGGFCLKRINAKKLVERISETSLEEVEEILDAWMEVNSTVASGGSKEISHTTLISFLTFLAVCCRCPTRFACHRLHSHR